MIYQGVILSNAFENGRKAATIEFQYDKMICKHTDGEVIWYLKNIKFAPGGAANRNIFITNSLYPDISIYTSDKKILKDPALTDNYNKVEGVKSAKNKFRMQWIVATAIILLLLSPIALFIAFRAPIVKKVASKIPPKMEQKAGDALFSQLSKGFKIIDDSVINAELKKTVLPITKVVNDTNFHFSFYIISDTTVNAFALPGGKVVINSGLIEKADSWEEVLGVVAHEIAHVTERHHIRGIVSRMGVSYIVSLTLGDVSGVIGQLAGYSSKLESLMYSREFEFEADNKGMEYLQNAKINTNGMVTFFEKLEKQHSDDKQSSFYSMLSTHPATKDRIVNLREKQKKMEDNHLIEMDDFVSFKKNLKSIIQKL